MSTAEFTNRLIHETSPYLLQHAHNPVEWFPWGEDAFALARENDTPIFLSIGYSACHWCHVMERESFENEEIAAILNREFVSIKVDREERPDVDSIYMQAVQMMTGHGGWPMSMFLTPEGVPFYGGTYFPPEDSRGMPGFPRVLRHVADIYRHQRDQVAAAGEEIRAALTRSMGLRHDGGAPSHQDLDQAAHAIASGYDPVHGGFGRAPKFPPSMSLEFLLQVVRRQPNPRFQEIIENTLSQMANGGIYDQIGGGFHRYSVDAQWLAPHFEKMLYDNALLARLYTHAWQWTKNPFYARIAHEVLGFVAREMTSPEGGFYSTLDADSEGEEGKFYVWSRDEVLEVLGEKEGRIFAALFDVTEGGNWEGKNILRVPRSRETVAADFGLTLEELEAIVARGQCALHGKRATRIAPARDEKVLAGWNGWMLAAFAEAALAFDQERTREIVRRNADFLLDRLVREDHVLRTWKDGQARIAGVLEDYAGVAWGLVAAFEATQNRRYLDSSRRLARRILEHFRDPTDGGFFDTADDHEPLITRPKDPFDNATPSGNSLAIDVLYRLSLYFGEPDLARAARDALSSLLPLALKYPSGFGMLLSAAEWAAGRPKEIAITGQPGEASHQALLRVVGETYLPHRILVSNPSVDLPLMEGRDAGATAAWVCEQYRCLEPVREPELLREVLLKSGD